MTTLFVVCATVGGTILVVQFLLSLIGLGGDWLGADMPHDLGVGDHDFGGDFHGDAGGDLHGAGGDVHGDAGGDHGADHGADHADQHHGSASVFRVLSFRTVVAALAFFGLAGLAAQSAEASAPTTLGVALAAGAAAMYGVYALMQAIQKLKAEGTARIHRAVGQEATVYLRIPPGRTGSGKIQLNLQNRTMEYFAMSAGGEIPTGAKVVVTEVLGSDTVVVQPLLEPERK